MALKGGFFAKPPKIAKYVSLAMHLMKKGEASQRELQVVGGGLVYVDMFNRPHALWAEPDLETDCGLGRQASRLSCSTETGGSA